MPRMKIDFYPNREDAADALSSLREVGLNPGDVGGAWAARTPEIGTAEDAGRTDGSHLIAVEDLGPVRFSGWLAEIALKSAGERTPVPLASIFQDLTPDAAELARVRDALASGGGVIGVRARDVFNPEGG